LRESVCVYVDVCMHMSMCVSIKRARDFYVGIDKERKRALSLPCPRERERGRECERERKRVREREEESGLFLYRKKVSVLSLLRALSRTVSLSNVCVSIFEYC